ncbi:MAG TPA: molybdenum cofactor guanylyltransferase [bacterium]|nr:molybdenum cofactor guanylyltransferase [bacterium]
MDNVLVIMMGGKNTRMGCEKWDLHFDGMPLLQHIIKEVEPYYENIVLSTNRPEKYRYLGFPCIPDEVHGCGPIGGIFSVINSFEADLYQFVPCDTPFIDGKTVNAITELTVNSDAGLLKTPDGPQPLFSCFTTRAREKLESAIIRREFRILKSLADLNVRKITISDLGIENCWRKMFFNINSPEDLEQAKQLCS